MSFLISLLILMMVSSIMGTLLRLLFNVIGLSFRFIGYFIMIGFYVLLIKMFGAIFGTIGLMFIIAIAIRSVWRTLTRILRRLFNAIAL